MPLSTLLRRFRRLTDAERQSLASYLENVRPAYERLEKIRGEWVDLSSLERDDGRLGNTAAVYRWELARLLADVERVPPPSHVASAHRDAVAAFTEATRGCQLLATGHRFHKSETVCDGQILLLEAADRVLKVRQSLEEQLREIP